MLKACQCTHTSMHPHRLALQVHSSGAKVTSPCQEAVKERQHHQVICLSPGEVSGAVCSLAAIAICMYTAGFESFAFSLMCLLVSSVLDSCVILQWWCCHDPATGQLREHPYSGNLVNSPDELEQATRFMLWVQEHCPGHTWRHKAAVLVSRHFLALLIMQSCALAHSGRSDIMCTQQCFRPVQGCAKHAKSLVYICRPSTSWSNAIVPCKICTHNSLLFWTLRNVHGYATPHLAREKWKMIQGQGCMLAVVRR